MKNISRMILRTLLIGARKGVFFATVKDGKTIHGLEENIIIASHYESLTNKGQSKQY